MTGLAIALASIVVYSYLGIRLVARPFVTDHAARRIRDYPSLAEKPGYLDEERRFAAAFGLLLAIIWPVVIVGRRLTSILAASAPLCDAEAQEQIKQRDQKIADLERELGLRR